MLAFRLRQHIGWTLFLFIALTPSAYAQKKTNPAKVGSAEQRASHYFDSVRSQPLLLHAFLARMPKGGDLHNHLSGAIYAESFIQWAARDGLCIDKVGLSLTEPPCDPSNGKPPATAALLDPTLYGHLLDSFSMRQFHPGAESGHDHFFATFGKFGAATTNHTAEMLLEARSRAAEGHLQYMELMFNPDGGAAGRLGAQLGWNDDLSKMREQLLSRGLPQVIDQASKFLNETERKENEEMHCGQPNADPGCGVQARYLYQVSRGVPKEVVFAQILSGFEMASKDPRVVGLNLVMAEDWYVPIHDFKLHMQMLDFLHAVYPRVQITLHAGELTPDLVPPEELFHIRASMERGHALRIGHGVDVMQEKDPIELLQEMARLGVLVEVCLTSNDVILKVAGDHHPLPMYLKYGVPVALATDDAGVSRGDITQEYQRAAETYHLSYLDLKKFARASLTYSFLPGEGLGVHGPSLCAQDKPRSSKLSNACSGLLDSSEKARQQWALEKAFADFESKF